MKFWKKQLKKTNRGLVLALILIIGVAIFTIVDNINFKEEKPEIEQLIFEYVKGIGEFAVTPEELVKKENISEEEFKPYLKKWNDFINQYWVYKKRNTDSLYWEYLMSDMKDSYSTLRYKSKGEQVVSCTYETKNMQIKKAGPNCATASFTVKIIAECNNNPMILTPSNPENLDWFLGSDEDKTVKIKAEGEYVVLLERTTDGWKIYNTDGYISSMQDITNEG